MSGSPTGRRIVGSVLGGLLAVLTANGCTSAPTATPSPTAEVTSAAPATPTTSPPVAGPTGEPESSAAPSTRPAEQAIDITIADGKVTPNGKKLDVKVGRPIVLYVTSDEHDEVHAHTDGNGYELEVKAGTRVRGEFTIKSPGSYAVESHHLGKIIVILNAR